VRIAEQPLEHGPGDESREAVGVIQAFEGLHAPSMTSFPGPSSPSKH
jgi:hypothetical protein